MRGGRVVTMLRALFLSSLPLLRARWIRPTIQAAPIFPFSFHSVITIHHYGHRDDQGQTGTSCRAEDRRGNHLSPRSSLSFSPLRIVATGQSLHPRNPEKRRLHQIGRKKVSKKGLIRLCSMLRYFSFSSFLLRDPDDFIGGEIWRNTPFQDVSLRRMRMVRVSRNLCNLFERKKVCFEGIILVSCKQ